MIGDAQGDVGDEPDVAGPGQPRPPKHREDQCGHGSRSPHLPRRTGEVRHRRIHSEPPEDTGLGRDKRGEHAGPERPRVLSSRAGQ